MLDGIESLDTWHFQAEKWHGGVKNSQVRNVTGEEKQWKASDTLLR